ncbi:hypothetical protein A3Q56_01346 [Intoshia linei]|uniref:Cilia- and flagella-associated protein 97 n=1 Tax=Intoshia linei TaxID=1819745 RepID=A0A177B9D4_9BILA|nr:hypothetical protein A3Q56_01346 [Intoshia linei]
MPNLHRSYIPILPAQSKLLQKRWDELTYKKHINKLKTIRPVVDTKAPDTFMHLHLKLKKIQMEAERLAEVERDNHLLLNKMTQIMQTKGRVDNVNTVKSKSLNREKRIRDFIKITNENKEILGRLLTRKPLYSSEKWRKEWIENCKMMENIARFQKDWWKKDKKKTT